MNERIILTGDALPDTVVSVLWGREFPQTFGWMCECGAEGGPYTDREEAERETTNHRCSP